MWNAILIECKKSKKKKKLNDNINEIKSNC